MTTLAIAVVVVIAIVLRRLRRRRPWIMSAKWRRIRRRRIAENSARYGLPNGVCRCERCGKKVTGRRINCDHVLPRRRYPWLRAAYWNTQILCRRCNIMKSDRDGHHWRMWRQMGLHPVVWLLRWRQVRSGRRRA